MAKKVALDVLDIALDHAARDEASDLVALPVEKQAAEPEPSGRRAPRTFPAWGRRPRLWLLALGFVIGITAAVLGVLFSGVGRKTAPLPASPLAETTVKEIAPVAEPAIMLADFVVDLKDERGVARILFCDTALLPEKMPADPADTDWTEARNLIFLTLKGQAVESLLSVAGREQLKLKLRDELNGIGKTPLIRAIYFTAFEIL